MPNRLGPPQSTIYNYPALCARCGTADVTAAGQVTKTTNNRWVRFIWEKVATFTLTLPVCTACKTSLDTHTARASLVSMVGYLVGGGVVVLLAYPWAEWFALVLAAWWGGALTSRFLTSLYRRRFHHPHGVTWPDLCTYADELLTFKQPMFQREFIRLNTE
jgi:hypothetical protein